MWRIVCEGLPLTEVNRWDLEDLDKVGAVLDMKQDYQAALQAKRTKELKVK